MFGLEHSFQLFVYLKSLGIGMLCGAVVQLFDIFDVRRSTVKAIFDIIALVFCGIISFMFCYAVNFGIVRFYILAGEMTGYLIYRLTFGSAGKKAIKNLKNKFKTGKKVLHKTK